VKTGFGLGPRLSRPKDRTGPDLQTLPRPLSQTDASPLTLSISRCCVDFTDSSSYFSARAAAAPSAVPTPSLTPIPAHESHRKGLDCGRRVLDERGFQQLADHQGVKIRTSRWQRRYQNQTPHPQCPVAATVLPTHSFLSSISGATATIINGYHCPPPMPVWSTRSLLRHYSLVHLLPCSCRVCTVRLQRQPRILWLQLPYLP